MNGLASLIFNLFYVILFIFCSIDDLEAHPNPSYNRKHCVERILEVYREICATYRKRMIPNKWGYFEEMEPIPEESMDDSELDFYNEIVADLPRPDETNENEYNNLERSSRNEPLNGPIYLTSEIIPDMSFDYYGGGRNSNRNTGDLKEILGLQKRRKRSATDEIFKELSSKCCNHVECTTGDYRQIENKHKICRFLVSSH